MDGSARARSLTHYGVKGMKWGVTRTDAQISAASSRGGSEDFRKAAAAQNKIETKGTRALSNQELQGVITRMNLERQYHSMEAQHRSSMDKGQDTVKKVLALGKTAEDVRKFMQTPTGKIIKNTLKGAATAGAAYATGGASAAAGAGVGSALQLYNNRNR